MKRKTIKSEVELDGTGLHTGCAVKVKVKPAEGEDGVVFVRSDLDGAPRVAAHIENVVDSNRGTDLNGGKAEVKTVEHFLAALSCLGITDAQVEIDAPEIGGEQADLAKASLEALVRLMGGKTVRLEPGPRLRDKYDRMLAYVFVEGEPGAADVFVNAEVVRAGLARARVWGEPGARWDDVLAAEAEAREAGRGMWAAPGP